MSYKLRDTRITSYISIPQPNVHSLTGVLKHAAWVAGRETPEIKVNES